MQTDAPRAECKNARMKEPDLEQEEARLIVRKILGLTGLTPTALARKAGLSHTTLTRFVNNEEVKFTISFRTLKKLIDASELRLTVEARDDESPGVVLSLRHMEPADREAIAAFYEFLNERRAGEPATPPKRGQR